MTEAFRDTMHWWQPITAESQREIFATMGDSWFYRELCNVCARYTAQRGSPDRLADKLQQRWRKAGLVKYGNGKWYKTDLARAREGK